MLELTTETTGSSLLVKNVGDLTVLVFPGDSWTDLSETPYVNTADEASTAALATVVEQGAMGAVNAAPYGEVFVVPPGFATCALTAEGRVPDVRYQQDRVATAAFVVAEQFYDQLEEILVPRGQQRTESLMACARTTAELARQDPSADGSTLYASVLRSGSNCWSAYRPFFDTEEQATTWERRVLALLDELPELKKTSKVVVAFARSAR